MYGKDKVESKTTAATSSSATAISHRVIEQQRKKTQFTHSICIIAAAKCVYCSICNALEMVFVRTNPCARAHQTIENYGKFSTFAWQIKNQINKTIPQVGRSDARMNEKRVNIYIVFIVHHVCHDVKL